MALVGSGHSLGGIAGSNAIARLLVVISGDTSQLDQALARAGGSMQGFSKNIGAIGSILTRTITLPFLALGGAAINAAADYNAALARIAGLTPILEQAGISIQGVSQRLLEMANQPDVIATPTELADAFFFAGSAGLEAADAFAVVELAAQGASIGMGSAADISKVLIFALNNFKSEGLSAASAMDALTAAIKEGTAEPDEMAIALGRLLPIARQAGVTFNEVVASVAALTNLGVPTRVATTSLRALFGQLLAPTIAANDRLQELGTTADELRFKLQQGPIEAFEFLLKLTKGNEDAMRTLIPQIRGMTAFLGLNTDEMARYRDVVDAVNNSQGAFQRALDKFVETPTFQFQKGLQQLQVAGIELGAKLLPVLIQLGKILQGLADDFTRLPGPVKAAFGAFLLIGAAVGPIFQLVGALTQTTEATGRLGSAMGGVAPSAKALATGFAAASISAVLAFQAFNSLADGSSSLITIATGLIGAFVAVKLAIKGLELASLAGFFGATRLSEALIGLGAAAGPVAAGVAIAVTAITFLIGRAAAAQHAVEQMGDAMFTAAQSGDTLSTAIHNIEDEKLRNLIRAWAEAANVLNQPVGLGVPALISQSGHELAVLLNQIADANPSGLIGVNDEFEEMARVAASAAAAGLDWGDAIRNAGGDVEAFLADLDDVAEFGGARGISDAASEVSDELIPAYNELSNTLNEYQDAQAGALQAKIADGDAIEALADKYGVSTDYMSRTLSGLGTTAIGVMGENEEAFLDAAAAAGGFERGTSLAMQEAAEVVAEQSKNIRDALAGTFDIFEKVPKFDTKSIETYTARIQQWRDVAIQANQDMVNLANRGVPPSLIEQLAAEGPGMLRRFADATDAELGRIVTAYQVHLAAMDAEIIKERKHQEVKGASMVEQFAKAILENRNLPPEAARKIILSVTQALNQGDITPAGLKLARDFAQGLASVKGLTASEAAKVANVFVTELQNRENFNKHGRLLVVKVANGIHEATGLPKHEIAQILLGMKNNISASFTGFADQGYRTAASFARGVSSGRGLATQTGISLMQSVANGINQGVGIVGSAISAAAARIKALMDEKLKNSPQYFTYYAGQKLMKDMQLGIDRSPTPELRRPTLRDGGPGAVYRGPNSGTGRLDLDVKVNVDRRKFPKQMDYDHRFRGW